jgi:hypothetical protein
MLASGLPKRDRVIVNAATSAAEPERTVLMTVSANTDGPA